ncbi:MAG TPA: response regulator [Gemmatimonadaceae bacterium]|nr:response regulator [Gemmatimonadaceae bacterium]
MRIIIADDDEIVRAFVQRVIEHGSNDAIAAEDGREALELIKVQDPDLLITDLKMPDMDGFQLIEALRALPAHAAIPIICLTSVSDREDVARLIEMKISDYVLKPVRPFDLAERIRTVSLRTAGWKLKRRETPVRARKAIR